MENDFKDKVLYEDYVFDIHGNPVDISNEFINGKVENEEYKLIEGEYSENKLSSGQHTMSPLVSYVLISPNCNSPRNHKIDTITIHCMAGNLSVETCGQVFLPTKRQASSNYGVGTDGRIGCYCYEENRAWTSSSPANDHRAITIEVANDTLAPDYHVSEKAMQSLINLCADICRRNNIKELKWKNDPSLIGNVEEQNMTVHRWFANTSCPAPYLMSKMGYIADEVNKILNPNTILKGVCQMPNPNGEGFLLGLEVREDKGYMGEISIYDCSQQAWIAGTGKCYLDDNSLWWTWNPPYGYYWTLFRVWDKDEVVDEQCYGFQNI